MLAKFSLLEFKQDITEIQPFVDYEYFSYHVL